VAEESYQPFSVVEVDEEAERGVVAVSEKQSKVFYCRFCGENKRHSTKACTNVAAIKKDLACTDDELAGAMSRISRLDEIEKEVQDLRRAIGLHSRIVHALLDLTEVHRQQRSVRD
jgi:hypothetical protein